MWEEIVQAYRLVGCIGVLFSALFLLPLHLLFCVYDPNDRESCAFLYLGLSIYGTGALVWALGRLAVSMVNRRSTRAAALRDDEERQRRLDLESEAERLSRDFLFLEDLAKQDRNLIRRAQIARELGNIYGEDVWRDLQPGCHLVKRNAQAGVDNFYWLRADEILRESDAELRKLADLRTSSD